MNRNNKDKKKLEHFTDLTTNHWIGIGVSIVILVILIVLFMMFKGKSSAKALAALAPSMDGVITSPTSTSPFLLTNTL